MTSHLVFRPDDPRGHVNESEGLLSLFFFTLRNNIRKHRVSISFIRIYSLYRQVAFAERDEATREYANHLALGVSQRPTTGYSIDLAVRKTQYTHRYNNVR